MFYSLETDQNKKMIIGYLEGNQNSNFFYKIRVLQEVSKWWLIGMKKLGISSFAKVVYFSWSQTKGFLMMYCLGTNRIKKRKRRSRPECQNSSRFHKALGLWRVSQLGLVGRKGLKIGSLLAAVNIAQTWMKYSLMFHSLKSNWNKKKIIKSLEGNQNSNLFCKHRYFADSQNYAWMAWKGRKFGNLQQCFTIQSLKQEVYWWVTVLRLTIF